MFNLISEVPVLFCVNVIRDHRLKAEYLLYNTATWWLRPQNTYRQGGKCLLSTCARYVKYDNFKDVVIEVTLRGSLLYI